MEAFSLDLIIEKSVREYRRQQEESNLKEQLQMTFTSASNSLLLAGLQYAPYVMTAVQQVEATNLPGATKKAIVLASIKAAATVGEQVPEAHVRVISALIDLLAGILFPNPKAVSVAEAKAV